MCNGSSARVSQGGSIAVLRLSREMREASPAEHDGELRLLFSNGSKALIGNAGTQVEFQGWDETNSQYQSRSWVVIQYVFQWRTLISHNGSPLTRLVAMVILARQKHVQRILSFLLTFMGETRLLWSFLRHSILVLVILGSSDGESP